MVQSSSGPLAGVRIVEFDAAGAVPLACMLLADMGCDVVRIRRAMPDGSAVAPLLYRGRSEVTLDLGQPADRERALALIAAADGLVEGLRAGMMEQFGLGPEPCLAANPRLAYGRTSGWGLIGPLAGRAGNDINFLALSGALHAIGTPGAPIPPLNLVSEYAGGAMFLSLGMVSAILAAQATGRGQVVEAAQGDGIAALMTLYYSLQGAGRWSEARASNLIDGGAPFYRCYACSDRRHVAVGALEPATFQILCQGLGIAPGRFAQYDRTCWGEMSELFAGIFASRSRDEWALHFQEVDACVTPVLTLSEAPLHEHHRARGTFATGQGGAQPAPAPRFSATPSAAMAVEAATVEDVLARWA